MFLTNHSSAFLLNDVRVVKNVACLSSLLTLAHLLEQYVMCSQTRTFGSQQRRHCVIIYMYYIMYNM